MTEQKSKWFWTYLAQGLNIGAGVLVLPLALKKLETLDVTLWFLFFNLSNLFMLIEISISPNVSRHITFLVNKAKGIPKLGEPVIVQEEINLPLLNSYIKYAEGTYNKVTGFLASALFIFSITYFQSFQMDEGSFVPRWVPWFVFYLSIVLNFRFALYQGILNGMRRMDLTAKLMIAARVIFISLSLFGLYKGWGLVAMCGAQLISVLVSRILTYRVFKRVIEKSVHKDFFTDFFTEKSQRFDSFTLTKIVSDNNQLKDQNPLWQQSKSLILFAFSGFLMTRGSAFLISKFLPLSESSSFVISQQIFLILLGVSHTFVQVNIPLLTEKRVHHQMLDFELILKKTLSYSLFHYVAASIFFIFTGRALLSWISSQTQLLSSMQLALLGIVYLFELIHVIVTGVILSVHQAPFVKSAFITSLTYLGILWISLYFIPLVEVNAFVYFAVTLSYFTWKWPLYLKNLIKNSK